MKKRIQKKLRQRQVGKVMKAGAKLRQLEATRPARLTDDTAPDIDYIDAQIEHYAKMRQRALRYLARTPPL